MGQDPPDSPQEGVDELQFLFPVPGSTLSRSFFLLMQHVGTDEGPSRLSGLGPGDIGFRPISVNPAIAIVC